MNHRHVIMMIDEGLRDIFLKHRHLLKAFMDEAVRVVKDYFEKKHKITHGIIAGLHTFGSRLQSPCTYVGNDGRNAETGRWSFVTTIKQMGKRKRK